MILAADNLRITNPDISTAIDESDPLPIQKLAKQCETAGADLLDINSGPLGKDAVNKMTFFVKTVQQVSALPLIIDTANPDAMEAGLITSQHKAIINGFSIEPDKLKYILPLAKKYNADIIGYLLYSNGHVPSDSAERLNVAIELYHEFQNAGIDQNRLIIDPIIAPLSWENGNVQNMEILKVLQLLPEILGFPVRTIAGLSNLASGYANPGKKIFMEKCYIPMLSACGLDILLMNILHKESVAVANACDLLTDTKIFSWENLQ